MTWQEERRANRLVDAQIQREQAAAAAQVRIAERAALAQQRRADEHARAEQARADREQRAARRRAAVVAARVWLGRSVVELLIYPIALLSFVLAAPAMAAWGSTVYASDLGVLLPGITELGMWAFAVAVLVSRRRHPERPVGWLQLGVWAFAAVAFTSNLLHGLDTRWESGVVMGIVSVAGVVAHQLTLAAPPLSRRERQAARIERAATRKVAKVRRAAVVHAVAEIDPDGSARLVYAPGRYVLARRGRLEAAIVPGLPVAGESADWDREFADLLAVQGAAWAAGEGPGVESDPALGDSIEGGTVATLDREPDQQKSTPNRPRVAGRKVRSIEQLRAELDKALKARPGAVDPTSAESIRKALRCSPKSARQLRDEHRQGGSK
ncbi:hypothetical protein LWP59_27660 [Amycolatopsis acidiphila]|uniref:DUF2637 domain-containing protein n=1 Tax=Amycolatopsis acidiphila TaxID=715473 RepID=A0A558A140_9PSEU|nr:hypothetical protein [Amycolatopsis acidiphila]TVT17970.1 hypothetical protein FNH06_29555 [Amycolatopsis acidiphila]UIJ57871.1 hypothetical protein LWP59_27545 [Amycolatopsis acidiphila]UIJ57893.1 hypothetical protein LWP59_27660 [Amycolatopsis acidiphila]GHG71287.1 hypothetical protein GCM10017788_33100 [Amycolatopsis acidiphila]